MPNKTKTLTLSFPHPRHDSTDGRPFRYRVERVTDSVEFHPGDMLEKVTVETLCQSREWKVTVIVPLR